MPGNTVTKLDGKEVGVCWNRSTAVQPILYQGIQTMKSMPWKQVGPDNVLQHKHTALLRNCKPPFPIWKVGQ
jgi:hypothetical protein